MQQNPFVLDLYRKLVLDRPRLIILLVLAIVAFFSTYVPQFRIDASSDSLVLQTDKSLEFYRDIRQRYGSDDYLIITYEPVAKPLFAEDTISHLTDLQAELNKVEGVRQVTSMLNVPLISTDSISLEDAESELPTLLNSDVSAKAAKKELSTSPLYKNVLVSAEGDLASLLVSQKAHGDLSEVLKERNFLLDKKRRDKLTEDETKKLSSLKEEARRLQTRYQQEQEDLIERVRGVLSEFDDKASLHLGGVPMIIADSVNFIQQDLKSFGFAVLGLIIFLLGLIFRQIRWVILPMGTCALVAITVIGFLGFLKWPATIVSANFAALVMIFTLSFCVHQIVRYREIRTKNPEFGSYELVLDMVRAIGLPCFYMGVTTAVAFGSLVVSDIQPVIDFGWMMVIGIIWAFLISFTLFPAIVSLLPPARRARPEDLTEKITSASAALVRNYGNGVLAVFILFMILCGIGATQLNVQNRFIDYFEKDTEIYQGMLTIDQRLGGTTPMDVIVDAPQDFIEFQKQEKKDLAAMGLGDMSDGPKLLQGYWFSDLIFTDVKKIHTYLESLPATGKVISIYTIAQVLNDLTEEPIDRFMLGVIYQKLPEDIKAILFDPYIGKNGNQIRFSVRVYESRQTLDRQKLLTEIDKFLSQEMNFNEDQHRLTGLVVLYNNVLQSLFGSQIKTLWLVFVALFLVFLVLFRNLKMALLALVPNIAVVLLVLGIMGGAGIPLDIMTITIAAIAFGMANDNTIHYIHRFTHEYNSNPAEGYRAAVQRSHTTIGRAMFFTSLTITLGFSVLAFSNFVPTIYFGLLTGVSMIVALSADLALLPVLIRIVKPLGRVPAQRV